MKPPSGQRRVNPLAQAVGRARTRIVHRSHRIRYCASMPHRTPTSPVIRRSLGSPRPPALSDPGPRRLRLFYPWATTTASHAFVAKPGPSGGSSVYAARLGGELRGSRHEHRVGRREATPSSPAKTSLALLPLEGLHSTNRPHSARAAGLPDLQSRSVGFLSKILANGSRCPCSPHNIPPDGGQPRRPRRESHVRACTSSLDANGTWPWRDLTTANNRDSAVDTRSPDQFQSPATTSWRVSATSWLPDPSCRTAAVPRPPSTPLGLRRRSGIVLSTARQALTLVVAAAHAARACLGGLPVEMPTIAPDPPFARATWDHHQRHRRRRAFRLG